MPVALRSVEPAKSEQEKQADLQNTHNEDKKAARSSPSVRGKKSSRSNGAAASSSSVVAQDKATAQHHLSRAYPRVSHTRKSDSSEPIVLDLDIGQLRGDVNPETGVPGLVPLPGAENDLGSDLEGGFNEANILDKGNKVVAGFFSSFYKNFGLTWQHTVLLIYVTFISLKFILSFFNMFYCMCGGPSISESERANLVAIGWVIAFDMLADIAMIYFLWFRLTNRKWGDKINLGILSFIGFFTALLTSWILAIVNVAAHDPRTTGVYFTMNLINLFFGIIAGITCFFAFQAHRSGQNTNGVDDSSADETTALVHTIPGPDIENQYNATMGTTTGGAKMTHAGIHHQQASPRTYGVPHQHDTVNTGDLYDDSEVEN